MDKLYDCEGWLIGRFACDCLDAGHNLTLSIARNDKTGEIISCEISLYFAGKPSLKWRLKQAWQCLKGKDGDLGEFYLRKEDYPKIISLLSRLVESAHTTAI